MMEDELQITLTNDYAFKRLLGSEENKPLLQDLLECILDLSAEDVSELELMDKELTKEELSDKTGILDVKLKLTNGTVIDIEISGLSRKFCFITDCTALTSRNSLFFFFLIISADKLEGYPPYTASFSCSLRIRFLIL